MAASTPRFKLIGVAVHAELIPTLSSHKHNPRYRFRPERKSEMGECRPLGFLIGLPFALIALLLAALGAVVWILGSILSCICPCCFCCSALANLAMKLIKLPVKIIRWFTDQIPC